MESSEDRLESFCGALRNLDRLEREDFREIIKSQFRPTLRERYVTVNYHRAAFNVEMMLAIKDTKQFQTLSLLSRAIFELALEMKSINLDQNAAQKIELFSRVELLKSARRWWLSKNIIRMRRFTIKHKKNSSRNLASGSMRTRIQCGRPIQLTDSNPRSTTGP